MFFQRNTFKLLSQKSKTDSVVFVHKLNLTSFIIFLLKMTCKIFFVNDSTGHTVILSAFYYSKHKSISKSSTQIHGNKLYSLLTSIRTSFVIYPSRIHNTKQVTWRTQSTNSCAWFTGLHIANECGKKKNKHTQRRVGDANFDYARDNFSKKNSNSSSLSVLLSVPLANRLSLKQSVFSKSWCVIFSNTWKNRIEISSFNSDNQRTATCQPIVIVIQFHDFHFSHFFWKF